MLSGILTRFKEYVESLEGDDVRRFLELTNDRGHVTIRHLLLVTLIHLRCNTKQELLAAILKINQSNICRYMQFTKRGLIKILPTADTIADAISQIKSASDFKEIVPGRAGGEIKTDGTHVRVQRPEKNQGAIDLMRMIDSNCLGRSKLGCILLHNPVNMNKQGIVT